MIHIVDSKTDILAALSVDFIKDKQPLIDYAGFEESSQYAGLPRQTFSLPLSANTISSIRATIRPMYDQLIAECWPKGAALPFDMVRFDAFLNQEDNSLNIIELNTRNVGLHEIVEWLDNVTARQLSVGTKWSLNDSFIANQFKLHFSNSIKPSPLLYLSKPNIPAWIYFEKLQAIYGTVCHITNPKDYEITEKGIRAAGTVYTAVTRKYSWQLEKANSQLVEKGIIKVVQPLWMRQFGKKDYLNKLDSSAILQSEAFNAANINDYVTRKDELVLKIINLGGSKSVYLGLMSSIEQWRRYLLVASQDPASWVLQEYSTPVKHNVIAHGLGKRNLPTQLGIFVLPNPSEPTLFNVEIVAKAYAGTEDYFTFDPSGQNPDIWFGNVVVTSGS